MSNVILMAGLPGSGKTTTIVNGNSRWVRVSRDDFWDMIFDMHIDNEYDVQFVVDMWRE